MMKEIAIPILYGSLSDLTLINLEFINAKIYKVNKGKFKEKLSSIIQPKFFEYDLKIFLDISELNVLTTNGVNLYAILPIDLSKPFEEEHTDHFYSLLLALYPSDLVIIKTINLQLYANSYRVSSYSRNKFNCTGEDYYQNFLSLSYEIGFVNQFLKTHFKNSFSIKYIKYMLSLYTNSFFEQNPIFQYLSLMICLEVVVVKGESILYRLKRNVAIICGDSMENCKKIASNIDQLYNLRSAIVHGEIEPSYKNFKDYHLYLKKLVSKLIRELIIHDIKELDELNTKLTELGYSQNNLLSKNYVKSKYPFLVNVSLKYWKIPKYKR